MRHYILFFFLIVLSTPLFGQNTQAICGQVEYEAYERSENPDYDRLRQNVEDFTQEYIRQNPDASRGEEEVITIPVVVHVVYKQDIENIPDAQIQSQFDVLNEDLRRLNADASNTLSQFESAGADFKLEFCLASIDPLGNPTTGITRTMTTRDEFSTASGNLVKHAFSGGVDAWPTHLYFNFWICNLVPTGQNGPQTLGYATYPGAATAGNDGAVCWYKVFGRATDGNFPAMTNNGYKNGRTMTHEVGHWLNLIHTWGNGAYDEENCGDDDLVSDTPNSERANFGCDLNLSSCGSQDMTQNYMDYSNDNCKNIFTNGQKQRARALFVSGGAREDLVESGLQVCSLMSSIDPFDISDDFSMSPNPTSNLLNVNLDFNTYQKTATVKLVDLTGRVLQTQVVDNALRSTVRFDVSNLSSGMYFIDVETFDGKGATKKVSVIR